MDLSSFTIGILVCFILSFVLGIERQFRRRSLGLRTMILVAVGSYMFVSFSFLVSGYNNIDISRIASQVVAGIGFLGAGVIIKDNEKSKVLGLTTAATLWCDAAIGILCAGGFLFEAIIGSLLVLFANIILRSINNTVDDRIKNKGINESFMISLHTNNANKVMEYITNYINHDNSFSCNDYSIDSDKIEFMILIKKNESKKVDKFINSVVTEFKINKYNYKKIEEYLVNDEI